MELTLIYSGDGWLSHDSLDLRCILTEDEVNEINPKDSDDLTNLEKRFIDILKEDKVNPHNEGFGTDILSKKDAYIKLAGIFKLAGQISNLRDDEDEVVSYMIEKRQSNTIE